MVDAYEMYPKPEKFLQTHDDEWMMPECNVVWQDFVSLMSYNIYIMS